MQTILEDYSLKKVWCPISKEWFDSKYFHNMNCTYKYCKNMRWKWIYELDIPV